jgi:N-acetylglucosaminyl-diphospho-decaprenol L-rhamnosyltransferase
MTRLSVVIPVWNRPELVRACLASVRDALGPIGESEVIVVDDASSVDQAGIVAAEFPGARFMDSEENRGFAYTANRGMREARGEYLLLLNSDTELTGETLSGLLRFLEDHGDYAGVVPRLVNLDGSTQRACLAFPRLLTPLFFGTPLQHWWPTSPELRRYFQSELDYTSDFDVEQPPAACWLLRRTAWEEVGEFDERLELFFNDVDWSRRLADGGGKLRFLSGLTLLHHGGASTQERSDFVSRWQTDRLRYVEKHFGLAAKLFTKLCVSWTFADWWARNVGRRIAGLGAEEIKPVARQFLGFLRG